MPAEYPLFPSRDQMRDYILGFAAAHGLGSHIRFNTAVTSARPLGRERPRGLGGHDLRRRAPHLRRRDRRQRAPLGPVRARLSGTLRRARAAQRPLPQCRRSAGRPRARRRAPGTPAATWPSTPRRPAARPTSRCAAGWSSSPRRCSAGRARSCRCSARLPIRVQERVTRALIDVSLGRPERYGLPAPATRNLHRNRPVVNGQLLHFIHHGRVRVAPAHRALRRPRRPLHRRHRRATFDTIVYATGFKVDAAVPGPGAAPVGRRRPAARGRDDAARRHGAAVLRRPRRAARPQLPVYSAQARLIAKFLTAQERAEVALSALYARSSRPEARIDIPRHEWQRDMDRTHRRIDRILRRTPTRADRAPHARDRRDYLAIHG